VLYLVSNVVQIVWKCE